GGALRRPRLDPVRLLVSRGERPGDHKPARLHARVLRAEAAACPRRVSLRAVRSGGGGAGRGAQGARRIRGGGALGTAEFARVHDYVIVGAGSAGCVLANRLSEDPSTRVLLLEAGGRDRSLNIPIPAAFSKQFHTKLDWDYATVPEPHVDGRTLYLPP